MVPQTPFLFSATIAENIALAKPDATLEEVIGVAKIAEIQEGNSPLPGWIPNLGRRAGHYALRGQRQRTAIARALLQDAPVLILDDALSAVDVRTEQRSPEHPEAK